MKVNAPYGRSASTTPSINDLMTSLLNILRMEKKTPELAFVRVSEKFDVIRKSSYKGTVLRMDKRTW
jgi:hypothetical protein